MGQLRTREACAISACPTLIVGLARSLEWPGCNGGGETRRDRIHQPLAPVPALDQRFRFVVAGPGGVEQFFSVHGDPSAPCRLSERAVRVAAAFFLWPA